MEDYYNQHAEEFVNRTLHADVSERYAKFIPYLPTKARILDAGCGSGRDSLYFKNLGFDVLAFDASIEMVKISSKFVGKETLHLRFQDLGFEGAFDAIWASASLLHIPYEELTSVLQKLHFALKPSGILFASFKYGEGRREADNRIFYDMTECSIEPYLRNLFTPLETWVQVDNGQKAPSPSRAWLNIITRKL